VQYVTNKISAISVYNVGQLRIARSVIDGITWLATETGWT